MAVYMIYKNFEFLIPDAPELIHEFMNNVRCSFYQIKNTRLIFKFRQLRNPMSLPSEMRL